MTYTEQDCTIEHNGNKFSSGGAVVTPEFIIAYPGAYGVLKDWHGNTIGTYKTISSRPAVFFGRRSWLSDTYYFMRAVVNGVEYSLRGFGEGMAARGKAIKVKKI